MADLRSRKFVLTHFVNDNYDRAQYLQMPYDTIVISPLHTLPSPHYHIIIQHKNPISFKTLKNYLPLAHIEKQFGTNQQAYDYLYHKGEEQKEPLCESDILSNCDLKQWLKNKDGDNDNVGIEVLNAIENSSSLWEVVKQFPSYWRDVSKIKDLWNIHSVYIFHKNAVDNGAHINEDKAEEELKIEERKLLNDIDTIF